MEENKIIRKLGERVRIRRTTFIGLEIYADISIMNFTGIILGLFTLFAIGIGFVWVIKLEYYMGACSARVVLFFGILLMVATIFIGNFWEAALTGIISGSIIWGASELPEQEKRVTKGMFRDNPGKLCTKLKNGRMAQFINGKRKA